MSRTYFEEGKGLYEGQGFFLKRFKQGPQLGHQKHRAQGERQMFLDGIPETVMEFLQREGLLGFLEECFNASPLQIGPADGLGSGCLIIRQ